MEENEVKQAEVTNVVNDTTAEGTDTVVETGQAGNSAPAEKGENKGGEKPKQDSATNAEFARIRRENRDKLREAEEKHQKELSEMRIKLIKEMQPINPYTQKPIEDEYDVKEFLLMKKIESEGKDPVTDYPSYLKAENQTEKKETPAKTEEKNIININDDVMEFAEKHADVDIKILFEDVNFRAFADGKLGVKSLSEVYEQYLPFKNAIEAKNKEEDKQAMALAVQKAAVGALSTPSSSSEVDFFTKEQVLKMTPAEIKKNYDKIRESQQKW